MNLKMALFTLGTLFFATAASAKTKVFYAPTEKSMSWKNSPNSTIWSGHAKIDNQAWFSIITTDQGKPPKISFLHTPPTVEPFIENGKLIHKVQVHFETLPDHTKMGMLTFIDGFDSCTAHKTEQSITCIKN